MPIPISPTGLTRSIVRSALGLAMLSFSVSASAQDIVYVAFGDSITEGVGDELNLGGYPPRLQQLLRDGGIHARVRTRGFHGDDTIDGLARIDSVLDEGGDFFILMEGTNDINNGLATVTTLFNLEEMAQRAEDRGMMVVMATLVPRWQFASQDRLNFLTRLIAQGVRDLAGDKDYLLSDVFEIYFNTPDFSPDLYGIEGDSIGHPNAEGYDLVASVFADMLLDVDTVPPVLGATLPQNFSFGVDPDTDIQMEVWDFGDGIDLASTEILVNGVVVAADVRGDERQARIFFDPSGQLSGLVIVDLRSTDLAVTPNMVDRSVLFFDVTGGTTLQGDLNLSGRVDGLDLTLFGLAFGASDGERRYVRAADFDLDGLIDGNDLAVLAENFGQSEGAGV